ncbi:MAG: hypothetical protein ACQEXJ_10950 [Myxococcota bacterium]
MGADVLVGFLGYIAPAVFGLVGVAATLSLVGLRGKHAGVGGEEG